jgi:hypothetical protein
MPRVVRATSGAMLGLRATSWPTQPFGNTLLRTIRSDLFPSRGVAAALPSSVGRSVRLPRLQAGVETS